MDPFIGGSLISAGASLLGGLFGRKKKAPSAYENTIGGIQGQAEGARKYGEKYGFNPLTLLGVSSAMGPSSAEPNTMGTAIANAGMMFADGLARSHEAKQLTALERQNQELQKEVEQLTLKPKVGGIYAQQERTPTLMSTLGKGSVMEASPRPLMRGANPTSIVEDMRPPVMVWNPASGKHVGIAAGIADRLELKNGDTIMAEDYEAILGDVGSEIINTPNTANVAIGGGEVFFEPPQLKAPPKKKTMRPDPGVWGLYGYGL